MGLDVEYGSFQKQTSTGNQTVTMSGSFTPKFIHFFGEGNATADGIVNDKHASFKGWTSTTESLAWAHSVQSNNKNGQMGLENDAILILLENATTEAIGAIVSMSSGQFVINWTTNANNVQTRVHYIAIGGTDLTDIKIGAGALNTSTGNQSFTPTSFTPKIGWFAAVHTLTTFPTTSKGNTGGGVGCAVSSSKRWTYGHGAKGDKAREVFDDTKCIAYPGNSDTVIDLEADFVSFNSNGFTINITNAPAGADQLGYVLLGGSFTVDAGSFTSPTSTGTQAYTTGDEPSVVGLMTGLTEVGDVFGDVNLQLSWGGGVSATSRGNHTWTNPDNKTPESASDDAFVIQGYIAAATLTASTEDADIDSFNSTDFTLDWTKVSSTAYEYGWWMMGGTSTAPTGTGTVILGASTLSGTGEQPHEATGSLVTDGSVLSASAEQPYEGTGAFLLDDTLVDASGIQEQPGTGALLLDDALLDALAEQPHEGSGALLLDDAALLASSVQAYPGTGTLDLIATSLAASGTALEGIDGTGATLLDSSLLAGVGEAPFVATGAVLLDDAALLASGAQAYPGTGTVDLIATSVAASATAFELIEGTGAFLLDAAAVLASAAEAYPGTGGLLLDPSVLNATAEAPFVSTATVLVDDAALLASAAQIYSSTGVVLLDDSALLASASQAHPGAGVIDLGEAALAGTAEQPHEATTTIALNQSILSAAGAAPFVATGAVVLDEAAVLASAAHIFSALGTVDLGQLVLSAIAYKLTGGIGDITDPSIGDETASHALSIAHTYDLADVSTQRSMRAA